MLPGMMVGPISPRSPFTTDFREYAIAADLDAADWNKQGSATLICLITADTTTLGGKRVTIDKQSDDGSRVLMWEYPGSTVTDFEVLARIKIDFVPPGNGETTGQIVGRWSDSTHYYVALPRKSSGGSTKIFEIGKEPGPASLDNANLTWDTTNYWWIRFQVFGTAIKAKMWQHGTAEPAAWTNEATDSANASGSVGFGAFYHTDAEYGCDFFSLATGGKTAPGPSG